MSDTFVLADAAKRPVVKLDEYNYTVKAMTRATMKIVADREAPVLDESAKLDGEKIDALAYGLIDSIDVMLEPDADAPRAASVLRNKWDEDGVSIEQLSALVAFVAERGNPNPPA